jgi:glucan 1,4-alpha-glucosidase
MRFVMATWPRKLGLTTGLLLACAGLGAATPIAPAAGRHDAAPGGPGAQSYLDTARKDCFGTARNTRSKVWFTVADGVLSDVFSPTIENSNVKTLQYIVTDGRTFADLQQRDMTYAVSSPDRSGMVCRVTSRDPRHGFKLVTDYSADPARSAVLIRTTLEPLGAARPATLHRLKVYARYDATIDNTGGGGKTNALPNDAAFDTASRTLVATDTTRPTGPFAAEVAGALAADRGFKRVSNGFVGTASDGLSQLDTYHRLRDAYRRATAGNVVQTAQIDAHPGTPFTLALGFGPTATVAARTARRSAGGDYSAARANYVADWHRYDQSLHRPPAASVRSYWLSANVIKASEDKTYIGAFVASPTDPWGQAVPATTTHAGWTYREIFTRDNYETMTGLLAEGDRASAREMVSFLFNRAQQPDGTFPRDSLVNGAVAPDTFGLFEIDEDAYPLLMAYEAGFSGDTAFYRQHVRPTADFIVDHGPNYGVERWEEHPGYSPSTIAAEIAGLTAAARMAQSAGDPARARLYQATADHYQRNVKSWTVTSTGPYAPGRYFIRLSPTGNPNAAETYDLGNGSLPAVDQRRVIDAGFLELTRLGELPASDPDVKASLGVVDSVLRSQTPSGPGWHRYGIQASGSTDGYGDCYMPDPTNCSPHGAPWFGPGVGSGHLWPTLNGERAEQDMQSGNGAGAAGLAATMRRMSWGLGMAPEQAWEDPNDPASPFGSDPTTASIGFSDGKAAGSATPLIWAQAQYVRLLRDMQAGRLLDQPAVTRSRYISAGPPAMLPVTISTPAPGSTTSGSSTVVNGTTAPRAAVTITSGQPSSTTNATHVVATSADASGRFSAAVPTPHGTNVITVAAVTGPHASGWTQETVTGP